MVDAAPAAIHNFKILAVQFPAKVDFFHMREKVFVKSVQRLKEPRSDNHTSAGGPKYFPLIIVLAVVFLDVIKNATSAEWITQGVDVATGRARVLKFISIGI